MYCIRGIANKWFRSYLRNRKNAICLLQKFKFFKSKNSNRSSTRLCIGTTFIFNLYQWSLKRYLNKTKYSFSSNIPANLEVIINSDFSNLFIWLCVNKISLNISKPEVFIFRNPHKNIDHKMNLPISNESSTYSESVKYPGVYLDQFLNWNFHLNFIYKNLSKVNGIISNKIQHFAARSVLKQIYYALFFSRLNYACLSWGQNSNSSLHRVFMLQKKNDVLWLQLAFKQLLYIFGSS